MLCLVVSPYVGHRFDWKPVADRAFMIGLGSAAVFDDEAGFVFE
jgi:hypothetical protein